MSDLLFSSSRTFRVWLYTVGHSTLLLRSVKEPDLPTRVDVICKPVRYMRMPTTLSGLEVHSVATTDLDAELRDDIGALDEEDLVFALSGLNGKAWVVCGVVAWHEDEGDYGDPSHFSVPRLVW